MSIVCELTSMTVKTSGSTKDLSQWYSMSTASNARTLLAIYSFSILASITAILTSTCESVSGKCMISESGQTLQRCATTDMDAPHRDIETVSWSSCTGGSYVTLTACRLSTMHSTLAQNFDTHPASSDRYRCAPANTCAT
jgi:hypothetical protein